MPKGAKKMILILDVETISFEYNCVCDIAFGTVDRNKLITTADFIVQEHLALMAEGNFSKPKMSQTMAEVANGNATIEKWDSIMSKLKTAIDSVKYIYAYNAQFDRNAILKTCKALQSKYTSYFESAEVVEKWRDLWAWASNTILYKKTFIDFCEAHELITAKGYCSTSAETTLKFLKNDIGYVEQHTALEDIKDEFQIYLAIKKEIKKEFAEICLDDEKQNFKGKPFFTIARLKKAMAE